MKKILHSTLILLICASNLIAQEIEISTPYGIGKVVKKAHAETKKVAIAYFGIAQTVQNADATTAAGGGAYAKMTVNFGGVDIAAYQAVVKEVYDAAVAKLTGLGYEVLTPEQVKATGVETYTPNTMPEEYKINAGTAKAITIHPTGTAQVLMNMSPMGFLPFIKKAKQLNANMLVFNYGATAVGFERGSKYSKTAKISATPWLTFGGSFTSYPIGKGASPAVVNGGVKGGEADFAGPAGIYETSKTTMPWLGSSKGKYVLDINQQIYLTHIKNMLLKTVDQSITRWHQNLNQ